MMPPNNDFNSIKVQLKQSSNIVTFASFRTFQFHKGTIKARDCGRLSKPFSHFNSIKVQLKQENNDYQQRLDSNFNSIKVQLKPLVFNEITSLFST